ncbi:MAG: protein phosphatase 2C domain-containing protein [Actinomycetota bacterium]|nr:protein phosphatase 2C domain-containing protein [Actinomycetota bacterium]
MALALRYSATSDVGRLRKNNQDSGFASPHLLVVADGMGGAAAGDLASSVAVQTLRRLDGIHADDPLEALAGAVQRANDRLGELVEDDPRVEGMGTTVTAALFAEDRIGLAHIGDSRAYLLRGGELTQLTRDHTFVQGLIDEGRISEDEARTHPHRSLILRALDGRHDTEPDLSLHPLQAGDRLLLCSDGLSAVLDQPTLRDALGRGSPDSAVLDLLRLALDAGGPDNITCLVADVVDASTPVDEESAAATLGPLLVGAAGEQARGHMAESARAAVRDPDTGELDPVDDDPAVGHQHVGSDPEQLRYAPRAPKRFRWLRRFAVVAVVAALLVVGVGAAYSWTQGQYYVKARDDTVAIYRGIDAEVPGLSLSSLHEGSDIPLGSLPAYWREQVASGIEAEDLTDAERILADLHDVAVTCAQRPEAGPQDTTPSPSPSPSPDRRRTPPPRSTASPAPATSPAGDTTTPTPGTPPQDGTDCRGVS